MRSTVKNTVAAYARDLSWSSYASFLVFATVLILTPGPDFAVVTRNTLAAGRRRGRWSAIGVTASNAVQGVTAAAGLGALIVRSQPLFEAILLSRRRIRRWLDGLTGVALLGFGARLATERT
ncbi:LysE family translocator [Micromonospora chersina]|uniref:LysE family translocator n=1 Tax=Micromonospora chersina TaxID=47854 RepID=UPI0033F1FCF5